MTTAHSRHLGCSANVEEIHIRQCAALRQRTRRDRWLSTRNSGYWFARPALDTRGAESAVKFRCGTPWGERYPILTGSAFRVDRYTCAGGECGLHR